MHNATTEPSRDRLSLTQSYRVKDEGAGRCIEPAYPCALAFVVLMALAAISGCQQPVVEMYDANEAAASASATYTDTDWATVLRENVKAKLVDYRHLAAHVEPLNAYLKLTEHSGPHSTPEQFRDDGAALAYYINVYNACALSAVIRAGVPVTMYDVELPALESGYRFFVDGAACTLGDLRALAQEAGGGDVRVEFALCAAALGSPPLASEPYRGFDVHQRLGDVAADAIINPRLVRVDHEQQRLLVGLPIWEQREALEATYRRETASASGTMLNCLMHLASGARREYLARATGYDLRVLPFDRALNAWKPARPDSKAVR